MRHAVWWHALSFTSRTLILLDGLYATAARTNSWLSLGILAERSISSRVNTIYRDTEIASLNFNPFNAIFLAKRPKIQPCFAGWKAHVGSWNGSSPQLHENYLINLTYFPAQIRGFKNLKGTWHKKEPSWLCQKGIFGILKPLLHVQMAISSTPCNYWTYCR